MKTEQIMWLVLPLIEYHYANIILYNYSTQTSPSLPAERRISLLNLVLLK